MRRYRNHYGNYLNITIQQLKRYQLVELLTLHKLERGKIQTYYPGNGRL